MRSWGISPGLVAGLLLVAAAPPGTAREDTTSPVHTTQKGPTTPTAVSRTAGATHIPVSTATHPYEGGKINPHLTVEECRLLGGATAASSACLSGQVCNTSDETGYDHWVCISKTK
jgi:hypothetical protein